ncbi:unnamed protein product [Nippostrongylus brasiliensis]|uniref:NADH-quinone oxidoreductase subunit C n=1 Tax=Nippostrongylus brasiliensis TaxID=27835 RepID=A0A0N4YQJ3_NIPBR|nr:unnamed protein product [Nippostrongylus brasiliensis]
MSSGSNDGRFANEIETVRDLARKFPKGVEFQHVYAHDDDPGNEQTEIANDHGETTGNMCGVIVLSLRVDDDDC